MSDLSYRHKLCVIFVKVTHTVTFFLKLLVLYLGFAYSFDLWGSSLLLLQLLLPEHLQVGWGKRLPLWQLHTCGWMKDRSLVTC